jgi:hypothetical protein
VLSTPSPGRYSDPRRCGAKETWAPPSLGLPTLNEAATISKEILVLKPARGRPGGRDRRDRWAPNDTAIAAAGARSSAPGHPQVWRFRARGKPWKSLRAGDIIVWIDDINNIGPKFVYACCPVGAPDQLPGLYSSPCAPPRGSPSGRGRSPNWCAPLFSLFYPVLARLVQPLGEYAGRRLLERLPFSVGYGWRSAPDRYLPSARRESSQVDPTAAHRSSVTPAAHARHPQHLPSRLERYSEAHR